MASKSKLHGLNGMHTAGIFSDMTVDGPEIGTLVIIVDRAKNLPNRKTIGKQDPYCAARLGKEAKKTETDRRGGQTPRWDQELRFTVHDSPDYYQLKVSVFNDDKKTDLIGETWVDLKEVVVLGGGQNDLWHNLSCKGKYAGEIRIEITYYDSRPKQERPDKSKQAGTNGVDDSSKDSLRGPRQLKTPAKRRPLPSDPVTGAPAVLPTAVPDHVQTPPRGYPPSPITLPEQIQTPPRGYQTLPTTHQEQISTPPRGYPNQTTAVLEYVQTPPRGYQTPQSAVPEHIQIPQRGYQTPPTAIPEHVQNAQRGYSSPSYIPNQSPLQSVEYNTASSQFSTSQGYDSGRHTSGYATSSGAPVESPVSQQTSFENYESYEPMTRNEYVQENETSQYDDDPELVDPLDQYDSHHNPYDQPHPDDFDSPPSPGGPPPPPPIHRSRAGSSQVSPAAATIPQGSYGFPSDSPSQNQYSTPSHEAHRHSMPSHSHSYQEYSTDRDQNQFSKSVNGNYQQSPPRHYSYDSRYNTDHGSMQPTVEDAPPSPSGRYSGLRGTSSRGASTYEDRAYDQVPSPAPLNLSGRGSSASGRNSVSTGPSYQYSTSSLGYGSGNSQLSYTDRSQTDLSISSRTSYNTNAQQEPQRPRGQSEDLSAGSTSYGFSPVPASLVPGMDPMIAQEIADRIYDEKRASYSQGAGNSARGRYQNSPQYQPNQSRHQPHQESASPSYGTPNTPYDDRNSRFSSAAVPVVKPRAISPDPRVPSRKSVSPSPGLPDENRRLSGIPFGPDSYNALNPSISGSTSTPSLSAAYNTKPIDPDAKIITHDGREVDPSDHIPESNYAPLLETKGPKYASQQPDRNYRPPPSSQPVSAAGRRPLRQAGRPHSMVASSPIYMNSGSPDPPTPSNTRNRLQKKVNRMSAQPAAHSSPLAPISPYQDNSFAPKGLPRSHTTDFNASENYAPGYGGSPGYRGNSGPPAIPAKVPMGMTGPPQPPHASGGDPWALLEEMKSIDLGSGRARRRGY